MRLDATYARREIHREWESVYRSNPAQDRFNERIMDRVLGALKLPADALVLDAGCGTGDHAVRIARRGYRCVGVDLSSHALACARDKVEAEGLRGRVELVRQPLEALAFADGTFDAVFCRGVLMHIPACSRALEQVARVLKPGGGLAILEANCRSVETWIALRARRLKATDSVLLPTPDGLEFWSRRDGAPFVVRIADLDRAAAHLDRQGVAVPRRIATEFWDINRFPAGAARLAAIRFNQLWFALRLPASPSMGVALIGRKRSGNEASRS